jgi:hypothetical protein
MPHGAGHNLSNPGRVPVPRLGKVPCPPTGARRRERRGCAPLRPAGHPGRRRPREPAAAGAPRPRPGSAPAGRARPGARAARARGDPVRLFRRCAATNTAGRDRAAPRETISLSSLLRPQNPTSPKPHGRPLRGSPRGPSAPPWRQRDRDPVLPGRSPPLRFTSPQSPGDPAQVC